MRSWYPATGNEMCSPQFGYTDWYHPKTYNKAVFFKTRFCKFLQVPGFGGVISGEGPE
jgi:hypothetical protein